jgi:hypothetical protein
MLVYFKFQFSKNLPNPFGEFHVIRNGRRQHDNVYMIGQQNKHLFPDDASLFLQLQ